MSKRVCYWPRAVLHLPLADLWVASVRQTSSDVADAALAIRRRRSDRTVAIACERAQACGVRPGMEVAEAERLCPGLKVVTLDSSAAARLLRTVKRLLSGLGRDRHTQAMDAVTIDITHQQTPYGMPEDIAQRLHDRLRRETCHPVRLGVAQDPFGARIASGLSSRSRDAVTVIPPWESRERLHDITLDKIDFLDPTIAAFLIRSGLTTCGEVAALPAGFLERRFGDSGRSLWLVCRGRDIAWAWDARAPWCHGGVLPPRTHRVRTVERYLRHSCRQLARGLRSLGREARAIRLTLRRLRDAQDGAASTIVERVDFAQGCADPIQMYEQLRQRLRPILDGTSITHAELRIEQVTADSGQMELFPVLPGPSIRSRSVLRHSQ